MTVVVGGREADDEWVAAAHAVGQEEPPHEFRAPARTLSSILDEVHAPEVDLLSLDVEGYEAQVLAGLDLERHAPRFVLVEMRDIEADRGPIEAILGERYIDVDALSPFDVLYARADVAEAAGAHRSCAAMKPSTSPLDNWSTRSRTTSSGHSHQRMRSSASHLLVAEAPADLARRAPDDDRVGAHLLGDDRAGADHGAVADRRPRQHERVVAEPHVVAHDDVALGARMAVLVSAGQPEGDPEGKGRDPVGAVVAAQRELDALADRRVRADAQRAPGRRDRRAR